MMNFMLLSCLAATYDRRQFLPSLSILFSPSLGVSDQDNRVENDSTKLADNGGYKITLPIERYYGGTNCIRVSVSGIPQKFRGRVLQPTRIYKMVLDTGSPYFVIPHDSPEAKDDNSIYLGVILEDVTDSSRDDIDGTSQRNSAFPLSFKELIVDLFYPNEEAIVPFMLNKSKYDPTTDIYGSQSGLIEWKQSVIKFKNNQITPVNNDGVSIVIGELDEKLTKESGGPLLGLVKNSNIKSEKIQQRPTFLQQVNLLSDSSANAQEISSFQIDAINKQLTLVGDQQNTSLIEFDSDDIIELVDLRPLGDFVDHYAFAVDTLSLNDGQHLISAADLGNKGHTTQPIIAVFDTGLTGCLFTRPLWEKLIEKIGIEDPSIVKSVEILKRGGKQGNHISIQSDNTRNPFYYVASIDLDWFDDIENPPFVIILGQTFLSQGSLTIDCVNRIATFRQPQPLDAV